MSIPIDQTESSKERLLAAYQQALGHELPNRLVAIQGLIQLLQIEENAKLSLEGREVLEQLAVSSRGAHELVRALAEVGQVVRAARATVPIPLEDVAREAGLTVKQLYPNVAIEYHFTNPPPTLPAARPALFQVFVHLVRNAAQAAFGERPLRIEVGGCETKKGVDFWVVDNGRGMTEVERSRLFGPFIVGAQDSARKGLGLFLVQQLVDTWGGTLHVKSTPGLGTTARVHL
jgi:signal transduction histidine kinase